MFNCLFAYALFVLFAGYFIPKGGADSVWLLCAISYWLLTLLSAPWFSPPRDSLISAVGSLLLLLSFTFDPNEASTAGWLVLRWMGVVYAIVVVGIATSSMALLNTDAVKSKVLYRINSVLGTGVLLFSLPAVISFLYTYAQDQIAIASLTIFWLLFVVGGLIEKLVKIWRFVRASAEDHSSTLPVGNIERVDFPNLVRVRLNSPSLWKPGAVFAANLSDGSTRECLSLFSQTQGTETVGTGFLAAHLPASHHQVTGEVLPLQDPRTVEDITHEIAGTTDCTIAGFVVEGSSISTVRFELCGDAVVHEGFAVFALLDGKRVYYQVVGAETGEESFDSNPLGKQIAIASQLGSFETESGFEKFPWIPPMNTPLFRQDIEFKSADEESDEQSGFLVGKVPSTNIPVYGLIDSMVDHHTAILGATGTGKTELALDVIRQALSEGTKVFCVDFTGEYKHRLNDRDPIFLGPSKEQADELDEKLFDVETGSYGAGAEKRALREEMDKLRDETKTKVAEFLESDENYFTIFELAEITNSAATLSLTELYLSAIMDWARKHRQARKILIVLEEAHTIVPESTGSGFDFGTQWIVSKIGQIALQGRKYGVGLLIITQRTALVSKTILSQCNTFLTHSLIDQTSLGFLTNVYSPDHCRLIPNLGKFEFIAYGKGILADNPIVLKRDFDPAIKAASDALREELKKPAADAVETPED